MLYFLLFPIDMFQRVGQWPDETPLSDFQPSGGIQLNQPVRLSRSWMEEFYDTEDEAEMGSLLTIQASREQILDLVDDTLDILSDDPLEKLDIYFYRIDHNDEIVEERIAHTARCVFQSYWRNREESEEQALLDDGLWSMAIEGKAGGIELDPHKLLYIRCFQLEHRSQYLDLLGQYGIINKNPADFYSLEHIEHLHLSDPAYENALVHFENRLGAMHND